MNLEAEDGQNLVVTAIRDTGAVWEYNKAMENRPARLVKPGCAIIEANSVRGSAHELLHVIQRTIKAGGSHRLVFRRPMEFCATVNKQSKKLGLLLGLHIGERGPFLVVRGVNSDGAVKEHNNRKVEEEVKSYDRIVEVNGCQGDPKQLLDCIQKSDVCKMRIQRFRP